MNTTKRTVSDHAKRLLPSTKLSGEKCPTCKSQMARFKFRLQNVTQAIVAAFEAYDGASYGLTYTTLDFEHLRFNLGNFDLLIKVIFSNT